jgi:protein Mpv17
MNILRMVSTTYGASLDAFPVLTEMCTSGFIWFVGDLTTQYIEHINSNTGKKAYLDVKRTFHQTLYASIIWGPIAHKWYHLLDQLAIVMIANPTPSKMIATKLLLEIVLLHSLSLLAYFSIVGFMSGDTLRQIQQQLKEDFWPTYVIEIGMWTPLDVLNFALVPVRHQLLVVNCGCFIESIALSFIKNNGTDRVKQLLSISSIGNNEEKEKLKKEETS